MAVWLHKTRAVQSFPRLYSTVRLGICASVVQSSFDVYTIIGSAEVNLLAICLDRMHLYRRVHGKGNNNSAFLFPFLHYTESLPVLIHT